MNAWVWLAVAGAGALGSVLRYSVDAAVGARQRGLLPLGTLGVNLSGSLVFGTIAGLAVYHAFPATPEVVLGSGLCGAYTTFSTFTFETLALGREGERVAAVGNVALNLVGCCLGAALGLVLASL